MFNSVLQMFNEQVSQPIVSEFLTSDETISKQKNKMKMIYRKI